MPTVLRVEGYRFYFFSHDGPEPPHIHVDLGGASAKYWLSPVTLARNFGFSPRELMSLMRLVRENEATLLEAWHGHFRTGGR